MGRGGDVGRCRRPARRHAGGPATAALARVGRRLATEQRALRVACAATVVHDPADPAARALADRQALLALAAAVLGVREAAAGARLPFLGEAGWALLALGRTAGRLGLPLPDGTPDPQLGRVGGAGRARGGRGGLRPVCDEAAVVSANGPARGRTPALSFPPPCPVPGPDGPWEEVQERIEATGRAVVHTTWGQWLTPALLDPGLRTLLGHDWPRYRQHPAAADRMTLAVSRAVLKYTAAAALQVSAGRLDLAYLPGGRPVLRGLGADLRVSLTHTDELIAVGVSTAGPIGVDAESAGRRISFGALRRHVCTAEEAELLAALPEEERTDRLLRLWTLKEAYTKALGHGMRRRFSAVGFGWDAAGTPGSPGTRPGSGPSPPISSGAASW
ncbi:4'-phosphopantetheinyl transferase family protein [Streptomyces lasalocidi]